MNDDSEGIITAMEYVGRWHTNTIQESGKNTWPPRLQLTALSELGLYPGTVIERLLDVELRITHQRRVDIAYNIQCLEI